MYVCMYVCMYICMYYVYPSQSIQNTSIAQFPLLDSMKSNRTRSYSFTRSHSVSAEHTKLSQYALRSGHCICLFALLHRTHATRDISILVYIICSAWPGPFSRPLREGKGSIHGEAKFWCRLQSKQLCTMQGQRSFVLHESTQEWCSVTFSGNTAKPTTQPIHTTSPSSAGLAHQGSWAS